MKNRDAILPADSYSWPLWWRETLSFIDRVPTPKDLRAIEDAIADGFYPQLTALNRVNGCN